MNTSIATKYEKIAEFMDDIMPKSWSCDSLQSSLFLAPEGPRVCCKRFFVDGEMRGDVKCSDRKDLITRINAGESTDCDGCPHLKFQKWGEPKVTYLSVENFRICNLRCSYCSKEYYEGGYTDYDFMVMGPEEWDLKTIVISGGEPTMAPMFDQCLTYWQLVYPSAKIRVLTNATKYSPHIELLLANGGEITVSVDAGTQDTYYKVRGKRYLHDVIANLKRYAAIKPEAVTIKYILTEGNSSNEELKAFAKLMEPLKACNFQISADFKQERHPSMYLNSRACDIKHLLLHKTGAEVVFFDELLTEQFGGVMVEGAIVWGAGRIAELSVEPDDDVIIVDDSPEKQGSYLNGHKVHAPEEVDLKSRQIVIAASQSYPEIYRKLKKQGLL